MLVEFSVENYKSFRDRVTLSMAASPDHSMPKNVIKNAQGTGLNLLKSAAIYGANASGKSNLIDAVNFMKYFVSISSRESQSRLQPDIPKFKLDLKYISRPSRFETTLIINGVLYSYGFVVSKKGILKEWLHSYPKKQKRVLFERKSPKPPFSFGTHWKGPGKSIQDKTRENALFLSVAGQFNNDMARNVIEWFSNGSKSVSGIEDQAKEEIIKSLLIKNNTDIKETLISIMNNADLRIMDVGIQNIPLNQYMKETFGKGDPWYRFPVLELIKDRTDFEEEGIPTVVFNHQGRDKKGKIINLPLNKTEESHGTQKIWSLIFEIIFADTLGLQLFADELDVRLHPSLSRWLIKYFHEKTSPQKGAQLIFTTHDASLLDAGLFRRDQIFLMEKDNDGASKLYSIADFKGVRKDTDLYGNYLKGRFGGVPILGDVFDGEAEE